MNYAILILQFRFRPLAGMSCFKVIVDGEPDKNRFRPLAGMSCFSPVNGQVAMNF